ncbi:MAG: M20/M25/M40 family metallo-hydrolase [Betaproteobacteria bacterium]|nr:M20/M25/M40 family metallo-hydrolase [Betaproteobacteria bacterium]
MNARQKIKAFLARERDAQTRFLAEMVKVPSDNPPGDCRPHAERAAELLGQLGLKVEQHAVPDAQVRANGMLSCTNLIVRERFGADSGSAGAAGPVVACNAHGDVVPPGSGWSADPYGAEIRDGVMYGRGVAVSKSDFATYTWALLALRAALEKKGGSADEPAALCGVIELHFTYDEEVGGAIGPVWLLENGLTKPDFVISAGFSHGITTAHNGALHLEVELQGKSAHAAVPDSGDDALEAATFIMADLYRIRREYGALRSRVPGIESPTLVVGLINGGTSTNVVPDNVKFRLDRRIIPDEDPEDVEKTLTAQIMAAAAHWPAIRCNVRRILLARPFVPIAGQERLVEAIRGNAEAVFGEDIQPHGVAIFTDARHYSAAGIPTVLYGAGPRNVVEANGHRADERLVLDDLYKATEVLALTFLDLLSVE